MIANQTKWVAILIVITSTVTTWAFPIYFADRVYHSLEQLDEALEYGEITQEFYDEALDFMPDKFDQSLNYVYEDAELLRQGSERKSPELRYLSQMESYLDGDMTTRLLDSWSLRGDYYRGRLQIENNRDRSHAVRYFTASVRRSGWELVLGGLRPRYGLGVTVGQSGLHSALRHSDGLSSTFLFPIRHRENGISFYREFAISRFSGFVSRVQGDRLYRQSYGADLEVKDWKVDFGLILLRQQIGELGASSHVFNYIAPHIQKVRRGRAFFGESSFQIGGASAHHYRFSLESRAYQQVYSIFSYGKNYRNVESGGFAYSDYDNETINDLGLEYRDKRPGRTGVTVEQVVRTKDAGTFSAQLIRWEDRRERRQCVAGQLEYQHKFARDNRTIYRLRTEAIWQDLDIENGSDIRRLFAVTTEYNPTTTGTYENYLKIEQRVLGSAKRYPFRSRHDIGVSLIPNLQSSLMINYYDSDLSSGDNEQFTIAVGQKMTTGNEFMISARLQTRYRFATDKLDNWELRLNLAIVI